MRLLSYCIAWTAFLAICDTVRSAACDNTCETCSEPGGSCVQPKLGYYLANDNQIYKCRYLCANCTSFANCLACDSGFYLSGGADPCQYCPKRCSKCVNSTQCQECNSGHELSADGTVCTYIVQPDAPPGGLSQGAIIGLIAGGVGFVVAVSVVICLCCRRKGPLTIASNQIGIRLPTTQGTQFGQPAYQPHPFNSFNNQHDSFAYLNQKQSPQNLSQPPMF